MLTAISAPSSSGIAGAIARNVPQRYFWMEAIANSCSRFALIAGEDARGPKNSTVFIETEFMASVLISLSSLCHLPVLRVSVVSPG